VEVPKVEDMILKGSKIPSLGDVNGIIGVIKQGWWVREGWISTYKDKSSLQKADNRGVHIPQEHL
jgi:hypothetical protein